MKKALMMLLWMLVIAPWAMAQDEEAVEDLDQVRYWEMTPPFVTNFGGPGKMRYIKTEVTLQVNSAQALRDVTYHSPSIRHALVMLLSKQTVDSVETVAGQEVVRQEALQIVQQLMTEEVGEPTVEELLFTSFYVQN